MARISRSPDPGEYPGRCRGDCPLRVDPCDFRRVPESREVDAVQAPTSREGIRLPFSNQLLTQEDFRKLGALKGVADTASSQLLWEFAPEWGRTVMGIDIAQANLGPVIR